MSTNLLGYIHITNSPFINNFARNYGGGIYAAGLNLSVYITSSSFINNTALTLGGGAIYSNSRYSNVTLASSTFSHNSASYCSVLDVDEYYHFNVNLTDSVFTHNTATGQLIGGGVACIRNASINIIRSTFKHNYADLHGGVFYIDESATSVDGSLFVNNSAAVDGGVFYTYVHASNYNIRRSQFSLNSAGDDGGVLFIGRVNSRVNMDESIFSFNDASDRGGVVAIIASSMYMEINRTNIFNNTASFGGIISACNSEVTVLEEDLFVSTDPVYSFCKLYDGDITNFNVTAPQDLDEIISSTTVMEEFTATTTITGNTYLPMSSQVVLISSASMYESKSNIYSSIKISSSTMNELSITSTPTSTTTSEKLMSLSTVIPTETTLRMSSSKPSVTQINTSIKAIPTSSIGMTDTESTTSVHVLLSTAMYKPTTTTPVLSDDTNFTPHIEVISTQVDTVAAVPVTTRKSGTLLSSYSSYILSPTPKISPITFIRPTLSDIIHDTSSEPEFQPSDAKEIPTAVYFITYFKDNSLQLNITTAIACLFIISLIITLIWIIQKLYRRKDKKHVTPSMFHRSSKSAHEVHNFADKKCDGNSGDTEEFKEKEDFFN